MNNPPVNLDTLSPEQRQALALLLKRRGIDTLAQLPIPRLGRDEPLPLSYGQQRLWFLARLAPDSAAYHIGDAVRLCGPLDTLALQRAVDSWVARHESLRTTFLERDGQPMQRIHADMAIPVRHIDLSDQPEQAQHWVETDLGQVFDLEQGPLLRVTLLRLAPETHVLALTMHHIVADEWSLNLLLAEFTTLYDAYRHLRTPDLPPLPIGYADYAVWQRDWLAGSAGQQQREYWTAQLAGEPPLLELPTDHPRPAVASDRGAKLEFTVPETVATGLRTLCREQGATVFMGLLAAFKALLYRYTGQGDMWVGVPIANRTRKETESLVGFFVNTQVLRTRLHAGLGFADILARVRDTALGAQSHPDLPFDQLVEALRPERSADRNPLFQVMYNHQRLESAPLRGLVEVRIEPFARDSQTTQFDLSLDTSETADGDLSGLFSYARDLFEPETILRLARHFQVLLAQLVATPERPLGALSLLTAEEQARLAQVPNFTYTAPLPVLIRRQAERRPGATALLCEGKTLSYGELEQWSNRLAHRLIRLGAKPETAVGVALGRSLEMVVAALAVLKAGAVYVPLDAVGANLFASSQRQGANKFAPTGLYLSSLPLDLDTEPDTAPEVSIHPKQLAYVIHTSGSTGQPKGVAVSHGALAMHIQAMAELYGLEPSDRCLHFAAPIFDAALEQWAVPLSQGASLVIAPELWSAERTLTEIATLGITRVDLPPAYLAELAARAEQPPILRTLTVGGEALARDTYDLAMRRLRPQSLVNAYGPTETVITPLAWMATPDTACPTAYAPIGVPVGTRSAYVLDGDLNLLPVGVVGELYIGGVGLARGYSGQPGMTAERFVPNPFVNRLEENRLEAGDWRLEECGSEHAPLPPSSSSLKPPASSLRLYRTGDRARQRPDGTVEYLGRVDRQVKIRGYRIEPGEIEAQLLTHPGVTEAAVIAYPGAHGTYLAAYVTASRLDTSPEHLLAYLGEHLPSYKIPARLVILDRLPRTSGGKLDYKALPEPERATQTDYLAPRDATETTLAAIWADVLGIERVGVADNFFELGGDSIISLQVVSRARQAGLVLTPKAIFRHQTLAALARVAQPAISVVAESGPVTGIVPLTPIQADFFATDIPARHHWNQSLLLDLRRPIDPARLATVLRELVGHHDALRLRFRLEENRLEAVGWRLEGEGPSLQPQASSLVQWYADAETAAAQDLLWTRRADTPEALTAIAEEAQRSLNLGGGPLLRAAHIRLADGGERLLLVVHHLVMDGVSWRILLEDLEVRLEENRLEAVGCRLEDDALSSSLKPQASSPKPQAPSLNFKTSPFQLWAAHLVKHVADGGFRTELGYWQQQSAADPIRDFPVDAGQVRDAAKVTVHLDRAATRRLVQEAPAAYRTRIDELLLTALARTLCAWSGIEAVQVELESHGREDLFPELDLSRTVGWFTSAYPVRLAPVADLAASIKIIKETLRQVPNRGVGYGALRYLGDADIQAALREMPPPRVGFNYLGRFDQSFSEDALFRPASEPRGDEQDAAAPLRHWLDINGQIYDGELVLTWTYSRAMYRADTVASLAAAFQSELVAIIDHCTSGVRGATPADFPLAELTQAELDALPWAIDGIEDIYPPTPMQQGMLFHSLYEDAPTSLQPPASSPKPQAEPAAYVTQFDVSVDGLDPERFRQAWQAAMDRHGILRTGFPWQGDRALQVVHKSLALPLNILDWRGQDQSQARLDTLCRSEHAQGFDVACPPLFRLVLVRLDAVRYHLIWTCHHLLLDGWSSARLLGEVLDHYRGRGARVAVGNYRDYIAWLRERDTAADDRYWRERLQLLDAPTRLVAVLPPPKSDQGGHAVLRSPLDPAIAQAWQDAARAQKITLNTLIQGAWTVLLWRYTGAASVAFGVTVSGRPMALPGAEDWVGLFINTLPIIQRPDARLTVGAWLRDLQTDNLALREHEATPLYEVQRRWAQDSHTADRELFDTLLVFENYPVDQALQQHAGTGLSFGAGRHAEATHYPLTLAVQAGQTLALVYGYDRRYFDDTAIARLRHHLEALIQHLAEHPDHVLGHIALPTDSERAQLAAWNRWERAWATTLPVHELIRRHAATRPDALALVCGDTRLSYGELERRTNLLAHRLIRLGAGPDRVVGLLLPRSAEMVVAMLATLKAGAAFLPLDPKAPRERLLDMLEDTGAVIRLEEKDSSPGLKSHALNLDTLDLAAEPDTVPQIAIHPESLAYLIHTSGSTGKPKAVAVPHGAFAKHIQAAGHLYALGPNDRAIHFAAFSFDAAVEQWAAPLAHGAAVIIGQPDWSGEDTAAVVVREGATIVYPPTAHLLHLADAVEAQHRRLSLRICTVGGEAVARDSLERLRRVLRPEWIINGYGPTETVVTPLAWKAGPDTACDTAYAPIGQALGERTLYVLDNDLNPLPVGVPGELYIGGPCLARGYAGRPGLTAERFIPNPFVRLEAEGWRLEENASSSDLQPQAPSLQPPASRLYRTGDRVRLWPDGTVEYLGRTDQQIKLRGYRIEPGEIEAALLAVAGVREAVVLLREELGRRYLAGYVGADAGITAEKLRDALTTRLPDYMIPTVLGVMNALPRTAHGKVDRKALPASAPAAAELIAPRNDTEQRLLAIWQSLLGRADIGVTDNFFELGGDSILSIQMVGRARRDGLNFTPKDVFQQQTIAQLARVVQDAPTARIPQGPVTGAVPLLPIQAEFFALDIPNRSHWNQSVLLIPRAPLDPDHLERALQALVSHHDALRLRYRLEESRPEARGLRLEENALSVGPKPQAPSLKPQASGPKPQALHQYHADPDPEQTLLWHTTAEDAAAIEAIAQNAQRSLNLAQGPLLRAVHIRVADGSERLLLVIHHLVVDGVSWRILLEDLVVRLEAEGWRLEEENAVASLPVPKLQASTPRPSVSSLRPQALIPKTSAFRDWALRLAEHAQHYVGANLFASSQPQGANKFAPTELDYWAAQSPAVPAPWPYDFPEGSNLSRDAESLELRLDRATTHRLLREIGPAYRVQIQDLLLAILARVLCRWTGQSEVFIELEGHGREDLFPEIDLTRTVGWFTSVYPVRLRPTAEWGDTLQAIKTQLGQIPNHGIGYGLLKYLAPAAIRERLASAPKPPVLFNYLGQFDASFAGEQPPFIPAPEPCGDASDPESPLAHALAINSEIYAGELRLEWRYSRARYRPETLQAVVDAYREELRALLNQELGAQVTPLDFPLAQLTQDQLDALALPWAKIADLYPLSPMQQGMLFHTLGEPEAQLYVTQLAVDIDGLDPARFTAAWQEVIQRHDILRTAFLWREGLNSPLQAVYRAVDVPVDVRDWRGQDAIPERLADLRGEEYDRGFDIARAPLLRLVLVRLDQDRYHLIWTSHHLLLDGWSQSQLWGEVLRHYHGDTTAPDAVGRYRDYIAWLAGRDHHAEERFWREQLQALDEPCLLAATPPRTDTGHGDWLWRCEPARTLALQTFAKAQRMTLNTLIQGAWAVLLYRHTGRRGVAFGATVAGRPTELLAADSLLGLFINTLPVIHPIAPGQAVGDWLRALQSRNLRLREHEHTPLYDIQRWAGRGGLALFDSLLVFENYPVDQALRMPGLQFGAIQQRDLTNYPLTLDIAVGDTLDIRYDYARSAFDDITIQRLSQHLDSLLAQMVAYPGRAVGTLALGEPPDSPPYRPHPVLPVHTLIRRQAELRPAAPALLCDGKTLSYAELEQWSNRLAHRLIRLGAGPETAVGVALGRSLEMVVAALAVFKAGAVYVPLDTVGANSFALSQRQGANKFAPTGFCLSSLPLDLDAEPDTPPEISVHPEQLAYLIYTSGSTGQPKGVAVAHGALAMQIQAMAEVYGLEPRDRCLHFAAPIFDAALEQWAVPLTQGASLVIAPEVWSAERTLTEIATQGITRVDLPPAYLAELAARTEQPPALRTLTVGGEALARDTYNLAMRRLCPDRLVNAYGPTETIITPLAWTATAETTCTTTFAPIGWPIGERTAYVLDADLNPLPVGVAGELYIGGTGLARGYSGQPGLTAERFIPNPFVDNRLEAGGWRLEENAHSPSPQPQAHSLKTQTSGPQPQASRLYRTGDRVRRLDDDSLEYLGRVDQQIKIRGYRIEPGEIEAQLLSHPTVTEAAVRAWATATGPQLVAYIAPDEHQPPEAIKRHLRTRLPEYMIPARIIILAQLPRLPSGKLDRKQLPAPEVADVPRIAPRTAAEQRMADIWREILALEQVGVTDDFFELGGHSLLALRLVSLAERRMNLKLTLAQVLRFPTIEGLVRQSSDITPLVPLNAADNSEPPLFCIHPAGGAVFGYQPLARALARPVYGIAYEENRLEAEGWRLEENARAPSPQPQALSLRPQAPSPQPTASGLKPQALSLKPQASLSALAKDYARLVMTTQPEGPCYLLGWSLGGALAMAMAYHLEQAGREVAFLGLVDSYVPGFDDDSRTPDHAAWDDFDGFLREILPHERAASFSAEARCRLNGRRLDGAALRTLLDELADPTLPDAEPLARSFDTLQTLTRLARDYRVPPLRVAADCWWSTDAGDEAPLAQTRLEQSWGQPARHSARIAADHATIVRAPEFLADIAAILGTGRRNAL